MNVLPDMKENLLDCSNIWIPTSFPEHSCFPVILAKAGSTRKNESSEVLELTELDWD